MPTVVCGDGAVVTQDNMQRAATARVQARDQRRLHFRSYSNTRNPVLATSFSVAAAPVRQCVRTVVCSGREQRLNHVRVAKAAACAASFMLALVQPARADTAELFEKSCAGCHAGGGNVVQAGATLSMSDLRKNGVSDPKVLYDLIYGGKGKMPGYGMECAPRGRCTFAPRLGDEDIQRLAEYTLQEAAAGWK